MGTTTDKLQYLIDAKIAISAAIEAKGGTVPTELSGYGPAIEALPSGTPDYTVVQYSSGSLSSYYDTTEIATLTNSQIGSVQTVQSMKTASNIKSIDASFFRPSSGTNTALQSFEGTELSSIGGYAFYSCANLSSVVLNDGLIEIGTQAFRDCSGLKSISLPNSLTTIRNNCFRSSGLIAIVLPSSLTLLEGSSFLNCTSLTSVTIPNTLTSIPGSFFYGCTALVNLTIPSSVTSIGSSALGIGLTTNNPTITFEGKTVSDVQGMTNYPWAAKTNTTFSCTDGTITI